MEKKCNVCGDLKDIALFPIRTDRGTVRPTCSVCHVKRRTESYRKKFPNSVDRKVFSSEDERKAARELSFKKFRESEKGIAYAKKWHQENIERIRENSRKTSKIRYASDPEYREKKKALRREWGIENDAESRKRFIQNNPGYGAECANKRRAYKLRATPSWYERDKVLLVYNMAKKLGNQLGIVFHVDHIVPLRGKTVCGLHCHANLQLLCKEENLIKRNVQWPDMP